MLCGREQESVGASILELNMPLLLETRLNICFNMLIYRDERNERWKTNIFGRYQRKGGDSLPKMCPLTFVSGVPGKVMGKGLPRDCQEKKCSWWTGSECAVLLISEKLGAR